MTLSATTKSPLASKTVWGGLIAIAGALAPTVLPLIGVPVGEVPTVLTALGTIAGAVLAIVGRFAATKKLG